jgi:hypothetical protein
MRQRRQFADLLWFGANQEWAELHEKDEMMEALFSLGSLYVSDFLANDEKPRGEPVEMKLVFNDEFENVRLQKIAPLEVMYGKYWYRSGLNNTMNLELKSIVQSICGYMMFKENDLWIDIACNDGTLLSHVPKEFIKIGIDPADDTYTEESSKIADLVIQDYFSASVFEKSKFGSEKAKIVTTIAMFYDLEDPVGFANNVNKILDEDGLWVLQLSYTPLMLEQVAFDNICHEHVYYYALKDLAKVLSLAQFDVVDVQLNDVNGGSFRVYAMKKCADKTQFGTQPSRDVARFRIESLLWYEEKNKFMTKNSWMVFFEKIEILKEKVRSFVIQAKAEGKSVWGYGASTKGNALLQYFDLDCSMIDGIAERSIHKYGLKTVGTNIPIFSEAEMRRVAPDFLLILPWHFISEFKERERDYLAKGGKFIVPCPKFEIVEG